MVGTQMSVFLAFSYDSTMDVKGNEVWGVYFPVDRSLGIYGSEEEAQDVLELGVDETKGAWVVKLFSEVDTPTQV